MIPPWAKHYYIEPRAVLVRMERLARDWNVQKACNEGHNLISRTWWAKFEDGKTPLSRNIEEAVALAFRDTWPKDWASQPVDDPIVKLQEQEDRLERLEVLVWEHSAQLAALGGADGKRSAGRPRRSTGGSQ